MCFSFTCQAQYFTITQPEYLKLNLNEKEVAEFVTYLKGEEDEDFIKEIELNSNPEKWPSCLKTQNSSTKSVSLKTGLVVGEWYHNKKYVVFEIEPDFNTAIASTCKEEDWSLFFIADRRIGAVQTKDDEGNSVELYDSLEQMYINQVVFDEKTKINGKVVSSLNLNEFLDAESFPKSFVDNVKKYGVESSWPAGIKTVELREKNKSEIQKYNAFPTMGLLSNNNEIYGIAWVPYSKNQHLSADLRPTNKEGFFLIIDINYSTKDSTNGVVIPKSHIK